jgi:hypothetical protein
MAIRLWKMFVHHHHRENPESFMLKVCFLMLWKVDVAAFFLDGSTRRDFMLCVSAGIRRGVDEIFIHFGCYAA